MGQETTHSPQETQVELPMGLIQIEGDARVETLAAPAQHEVVADLAAAANAAVAEDASLVIHGDGQRRIVLAARREALRESRSAETFLTSQRFQLAVARLVLAGARRRMIGHQQLEQRAPHVANLVGVGGHRHAFFGGPHAGRAQDAPARFDDAQPADAHGRFVLLMTQRRDGDALETRRVEHGRAAGHGDGLPVDG